MAPADGTPIHASRATSSTNVRRTVPPERTAETLPLSAGSTAPSMPELSDPSGPAKDEPNRRQEDVEGHQRDAQEGPPGAPPPEGNAWFRPHAPVVAAAVWARRDSTVRRIRCAVSSIESSEMSITGHPSRRWTIVAWSS